MTATSTVARRTHRSSSRTPTTPCASRTRSWRRSRRTTDWTTHAITTGEPVETVKARYLLNKMAEAAWVCGDPGIQYHDNINRWHTIGQHGADQRQQPVQRVHVPRRLGLQPGQPEPDEVRQGRRRVRHRGLQARGADRAHRAGDHRRQRELPDAEDRREQPRLPAARPRLRQPGRAAHEPRPGLRLATPVAPTRPPSPPSCRARRRCSRPASAATRAGRSPATPSTASRT